MANLPFRQRKCRREGNRWRKSRQCCPVNAASTQGKEGGGLGRVHRWVGGRRGEAGGADPSSSVTPSARRPASAASRRETSALLDLLTKAAPHKWTHHSTPAEGSGGRLCIGWSTEQIRTISAEGWAFRQFLRSTFCKAKLNGSCLQLCSYHYHIKVKKNSKGNLDNRKETGEILNSYHYSAFLLTF